MRWRCELTWWRSCRRSCWWSGWCSPTSDCRTPDAWCTSGSSLLQRQEKDTSTVSLDCVRMFSNKKHETIWIHIWQVNWKKDSPDSVLPINVVSTMREPKATSTPSLLLAMPLQWVCSLYLRVVVYVLSSVGRRSVRVWPWLNLWALLKYRCCGNFPHRIV